MEDLEREIKVLIVESLKLEGVTPESIDSAAPLFGDGLGLDSIDALELAMALRKRFGVKFEASNAANRETFGSVRNLAAYVTRSRQTPGTT
jgi:acyl carrier protein